MKTRSFAAASFMLLLGSFSASAQFVVDPPVTGMRVTPAPAVAGQVATLEIDMPCMNPVAGTEGSVRNGNTVTFTHRLLSSVCDGFPPSDTYRYPIGPFPPGNYTLVYAPTFPNPAVTYSQVTLGFGVGSASIPAMQPIAQWLLLAFVLVCGMSALRIPRPRGTP